MPMITRSESHIRRRRGTPIRSAKANSPPPPIPVQATCRSFTAALLAAVVEMVMVAVWAVVPLIDATLETEHLGLSVPEPPAAREQVSFTGPWNPLDGVTVTVPVPGCPAAEMVTFPLFVRMIPAFEGSPTVTVKVVGAIAW